MLKLFRKNQPVGTSEEKACNTNNAFADAIMGSLNTKTFSDSQCYTIYKSSDAVKNAISMITEKLRMLDIVIKDVKTDEVVSNPQVEKFLMSPNEEQSRADFIEDLGTWYLITGNCYTEMLGQVGAGLAYAVPSDTITVTDAVRNMQYTVAINNSYGFLAGNFSKQIDGRLLDNRNNKELYHTRAFTNIADGAEASSPLEAVFDYVQLNEGALQYNVNNFSNGNFLAGLLNIMGGDVKAVKALKEKIENSVNGVKGAGKMLVTNANSIDFKPIQSNNRDSMTTDLLKLTDEHIYRIYNIPSPLINVDSAKYSNYQVAEGALYNDAVLPTAEKVLQGLTKLLRFRGMLSDEQKLDYDVTSLEVMRALRMETTKLQKEIGVNTVNEVRTELGYEELAGEEGNTLTTQNVAPAQAQQQAENENETAKAHFVETLISQKGYSKEKALNLWNEKHK